MTVTLLLAPIVPHFAQSVWAAIGHDGLVMDAKWPTADEAALTRDNIELVVQVNGKLRAKIEVSADADKASVEAAALANEQAQRFISDSTVRKVIVVPGKLVNIVV